MLYMNLDSVRITFQDIRDDALELVDSVTSYPLKNAWFSPAFRSKRWDGKEHLMTFSKVHGYRVFAGCTSDIVEAFDKAGTQYQIIDKRPVPKGGVDHGWTGKIMSHGKVVDLEVRDYQEQAVRAILGWRAPRGRCMVRMPVRSGKTVTAGLLTGALGVRTLFVATSDLLLNQTADLFRSMFNKPIGIVGGGVWDPQDITVATIQTLTARVKPDKKKKKQPDLGYLPRDKELMKWINSYDLMIFDECHHLNATKWKEIALNSTAYWKVGLSATIYLDRTKPNERENIWLKACTGDVAYTITTRRLIEEGWLVKPTIEIHKLDLKVLDGDDWVEDEVYRNGIVVNDKRNTYIAKLAAAAVRDDNSRVMVIAQQHDQIDTLWTWIEHLGIKAERLTGKITGQERRGVLNRFKDGRTPVLVGNVFGEGVDIPECDVVINAEGGESKKKTIQRMRNLTPSPGKDHVRVIDFADSHNKHLAKHSRRRIATYRDENAFDIVVI